MTRLFSPEEEAAAGRHEAIAWLCPATGHAARDRGQDPP